jgi:hypothetical protein
MIATKFKRLAFALAIAATALLVAISLVRA